MHGVGTCARLDVAGEQLVVMAEAPRHASLDERLDEAHWPGQRAVGDELDARAAVTVMSPRGLKSNRPKRSRTATSTAWIRGALRFANPPLRIALATASVGASITASHVGNRDRKDANARSVLRSEVC